MVTAPNPAHSTLTISLPGAAGPDAAALPTNMIGVVIALIASASMIRLIDQFLSLGEIGSELEAQYPAGWLAKRNEMRKLRSRSHLQAPASSGTSCTIHEGSKLGG